VRISNRISVLLLCLAVSQAALSNGTIPPQSQIESQEQFQPQPKCQVEPPVLLSMPVAKSYVRKNSGEADIVISYRVAKTDKHQAFGFQYACPETVVNNQILFVFGYPYIPQFHMRNVFAALDIAFIDETGKIVDIQQMQPYADPRLEVLYSPKVKVKYAFEARAGYFKEKAIMVGDQLTSKRL